MGVDELRDCDPVTTNKDLDIEIAYDGVTRLDPNAPAYPCGLVAKSYFNDTIDLFKILNGTEGGRYVEHIKIFDDDIAWLTDVKYKFKNIDYPNWKSIQWMDVEDKHFIVWMRTAGLPNFRKLFGVIKEDIQPGMYQLDITNNYDVSSFGGVK